MSATVDGPRATVTLSRPQVLNALTPRLLAESGDALDGLSREPDVLAGEGRACPPGQPAASAA